MANDYIRPVMTIEVKKLMDVENVLGKKLTAALVATMSPGCQRKPRSIRIYAQKPQYFLNDGSTLHFYAVDLVNQSIIGEHFGGSADTAINNRAAQFGQGQTVAGDALIAIETYWNGKNMSWNLDVISSHVVKQMAA